MILRFRHGIRLTPSPYGAKFRERVEQNIRVRLYVTSAEYENNERNIHQFDRWIRTLRKNHPNTLT